jgi:hypothetical protein
MSEPFPSGITAPQEWLDGILPRCPNVTPDFVKHEVLTVLRDFFHFGRGWRDWVGPITLHNNQVHYSVELADYKAEFIEVLEGYRVSDRQPLIPITHQMIGADAQLFEEGGPSYMYVNPEGLLTVFPTIPAGMQEQIRVFVTMMPIDLCVPNWIKFKWYDAIVNGVLERLYYSPGPNYKPDLAKVMGRRYVAQRARSTVTAITSGTNMPEVVQPPFFAPGSQGYRGINWRISTGRWP